jgi:hypothetical protein
MARWEQNFLCLSGAFVGFARDETTKIRIDDLIAARSLAAADISVGVDFNIWIIPWLQVELQYRFQTRLEKDGKLSWIPRPLDK